MEDINILVVSDLHAGISEAAASDTKLILQGTNNTFGDRLISYIKKLDEKIDYLICTGDIGN